MEGIKEKEKIVSVVVFNISEKIVFSRISVKFPPFHLNHFSAFFLCRNNHQWTSSDGHTVLHKITKFILYLKDRRFER